MGLRLEREHFEAGDYERFAARLARSLEALGELLARPGFGEGEASLGAELELFLIDEIGRPLPQSAAVLRESVDPRLSPELDRFNLECNLRPAPLAGQPFTALEREIQDALAEVGRAAGAHGGRAAMIGILPTLGEEDLQRSAMTDAPRYRALSAALRQLRRGPFHMRIDGDEPLDIRCDDVTFEGANTSLQVHLRVPPARFAAIFNAVQLATGPALAFAANSPTFLGHRLWHETRVALFKQAVDQRGPGRSGESRVAFGSGWVEQGAFELFANSVARHAPLLPVTADEDPLDRVRAGEIPGLHELRLHQSTVWHWNRPVYDPAAGGHLRVEMRGLPAGPSVTDMVANTAFLVGLSLGLAPRVREWIRGMPFAAAEYNFYRAAQRGPDAELLWPEAPGEPPRPVSAARLVERLLPLAREGLEAAGVGSEECERTLGAIAERAASGQTGSAWQRRALGSLELRQGRPRALESMLRRYLDHARSGLPVHRWPLPPSAGRLQLRAAPTGPAVPETPEALLESLGGPALLRLPGRDRSRARAVATLLHGNEPSGLRAIHGYLREGAVPAVDALFFIGAVEAALEPPVFSRRQRRGGADLNRCFRPPREGAEGELAAELLEALREARPEALVDLHNNTGRSVPYGVGPRAGAEELELVAFFADRHVHSDLRLGALVEVSAEERPSAVIECGRAGAPAADAVARAGLDRYLSVTRLGRQTSAPRMWIASEPIRVEVLPDVRLAIGAGPDPAADVTLAAELDRHNFDRLEAGHRIGWLREGAAWPLRARDGAGDDVSREIFSLRGEELVTSRPTIAIMITDDPEIAASDCLFYVVSTRGERAPGG